MSLFSDIHSEVLQMNANEMADTTAQALTELRELKDKIKMLCDKTGEESLDGIIAKFVDEQPEPQQWPAIPEPASPDKQQETATDPTLRPIPASVIDPVSRPIPASTIGISDVDVDDVTTDDD